MNFLWSVGQYVRYYTEAQTIHNVHSPLAASLIKKYYEKGRIPLYLDEIRRELHNNHGIIEMGDYGAGSKRSFSRKTRISDLAKLSLSQPQHIRRLSNLCQFSKPASILELGTSFGLSALHLQAACPGAQIITVEGNPDIAEIASDIIQSIQGLSRRPELINARFREALPEVFERMRKIDFVFIDGDHTLKGTMDYVDTLLPYLHNDSIIAIHDIYWSREMISAWQECIRLKEVSLSIDFFDVGLLLFREEVLQKLNLTIIPYWLKPWKIELF